TAVGAPEGASVTYRILNEREEVFIHDGTGMISLTGKRFDREQEPNIRLLVQTVVAIRIDDVNDCPPIFVGLPYDVVVSSDSAVGEKILAVKAVDRDIGEPPMKTVQEVRVDVVEKARPIFTKKQYQATVSEAAPKKTVVSKVKATSSVGGHLIYTIEEGNDDDLFVIDMDT
ncbi:hypothetical protein TELCIR_21714, partial [Teladorsagia circumcincta]